MNVKKIYTNPKDELEARANRYTVKGLIWLGGVILLVWLLTMCNVFIISKWMMTEAALISMCLIGIVIVLLERVDNSKVWLKYAALFGTSLACGVLASILSFHAVLAYVVPMVFAGQYLQKRVIWITYGFNIVVVAVSELVSFYYGLCDLNVFFESMYDYNHFMAVVSNGYQGLALNENPTFILLFYATIPRAIILAGIALIFMNINEKGRAEAAQMVRLKASSELDFVTGTYNKNKFEEMAENYYPNLKSIAVIFWDVNNLKETNDEKGHQYGDALISDLTHVMLIRADKRCRVYRLGGDEFLMVIENPSVVEEESYISDILEILRENAGSSISVAVGTARGAGKDIREIVNKADENMYANKRIMKGEKND